MIRLNLNFQVESKSILLIEHKKGYDKVMLDLIKSDLSQLSDPEKAKNLSWFFKTGTGQYGEGDVFWGISVPEQRKIAGRYIDLPLSDLQKLLSSKIHEHRLTALLILVSKYQKADNSDKREIFSFLSKKHSEY